MFGGVTVRGEEGEESVEIVYDCVFYEIERIVQELRDLGRLNGKGAGLLGLKAGPVVVNYRGRVFSVFTCETVPFSTIIVN